MTEINKAKSSATIAFTLPISCQICLGKVKQPVVCTNQHVFCGPCMEVWLQRNQQCPACRINISQENPIKQVLGGLSMQNDGVDNTSSRELRRARMELIYKDYEEEITKLEVEIEALKQENTELRQRLKGQAHTDVKSKLAGPPSPQDMNMITLLNNKIKDATSLYDKVKEDMNRLKDENNTLKDKSLNLTRENQTLRLELANRSPRRFGRFTVAALENRVEASEKQVKQLEKALEKTDAYVEELEKELERYKGSDKAKTTHKNKKQQKAKDSFDFDSSINVDDSSLGNDEMPSKISSISDDFLTSDTEKKKHVEDSFNLEDPRLNKSSFDLEMPSPMTTAEADITDDSFLALKGKTKANDPTIDSCKKKLRFTLPEMATGKNSKSGILKNATSTVGSLDTLKLSSGSTFPSSDNFVPEKSFEIKSALAASQVTGVGSTQGLNVSMTPEMEDCMRLMDEAEKKLEKQRKGDSPSAPSLFTSVSSAMSVPGSNLASDPLSLFSQTSLPGHPVGANQPLPSQIPEILGTHTTPATSFPLTFPPHMPSLAVSESSCLMSSVPSLTSLTSRPLERFGEGLGMSSLAGSSLANPSGLSSLTSRPLSQAGGLLTSLDITKPSTSYSTSSVLGTGVDSIASGFGMTNPSTAAMSTLPLSLSLGPSFSTMNSVGGLLSSRTTDLASSSGVSHSALVNAHTASTAMMMEHRVGMDSLSQPPLPPTISIPSLPSHFSQ